MMQETALNAHLATECSDISRIDFLLDESNRFWILELNSMPGMTPTSLYPDACKVYGLEFPELVDRFVNSAADRGLRSTVK